MTFREGGTYTCTASQSPGYKYMRQYKCYKNSKGQLCLRGVDGFEDLTSMLVSSFRESRPGEVQAVK